MKRVLVIVGVLLLVLIVGGICVSSMSSSRVTGNDAAAITKAAVMAIETMDTTKVVAYFTPLPGGAMLSRLDALYSGIKSLSIEHLNVLLIATEGSSARVQASYDMVFTSSVGAVNTQHCDKVVKLIQVDSKWYINEPF